MKLEKLTPRERLLLLVAAGLLGILLAGLTLQWILEQRNELRQELQIARRNVKTLQKLKADIDSMAGTGGSLPDENRMLGIITQALQNQKLDASSIRGPTLEKTDRNNSRFVVEMSFNGISLEPLFKLLYEIEYGQTSGITVGKLTLNRVLSRRDMYDVRLTVYVIAPAK